jgi:hypothetical protein
VVEEEIFFVSPSPAVLRQVKTKNPLIHLTYSMKKKTEIGFFKKSSKIAINFLRNENPNIVEWLCVPCRPTADIT